VLEALLAVKDLKKYFPVAKGVLRKVVGWVKAVDGISFSVAKGETFSLVGESGCGKTTTAKVILLLEKGTAGAVLYQGKDVFKFCGEELSQYRAAVQAVFQDPYSSLQPRRRVGAIVAEPLVVKSALSTAEIKERVAEVLRRVGLNSDSVNLFPHEFSGGQRQRIAIARALSLHPSLIVLDEPVSALDVSIRAQIMNLLKELQEQMEVSYLLIAHSLATVRYMSQRVGVMYLGKLVEQGPSEELYPKPLHPYTKALISAALPSHPDVVREEIVLSGEVPSALDPPGGCRFHTRCFCAMPICSEFEPQLKEVAADRYVACHLY
jgi:oligopeptide/dipeptide ABC transporter ATP-binding protein